MTTITKKALRAGVITPGGRLFVMKFYRLFDAAFYRIPSQKARQMRAGPPQTSSNFETRNKR